MPASKKLQVAKTSNKNSRNVENHKQKDNEIENGDRKKGKSKNKLKLSVSDEVNFRENDLDSSINKFEDVKKRKKGSKGRNKLSLHSDTKDVSPKRDFNTNQSTIVSFCLKTSSSHNKVLEVSKDPNKETKDQLKAIDGSSDVIEECLFELANKGSTNANASSVFKLEQTEKENEQTVQNAFQFMMNSRYRVIGQNSSGKELTPEQKNGDLLKSKESILTKKTRLQEWADKKGAKKRKIEYEEKGLIIEKKLKTRAKRLKTLLVQSSDTSSQAATSDSVDSVESFAKKRKLRVVESDVESTCDDVINKVPLEVAITSETNEIVSKNSLEDAEGQNESGSLAGSSLKEDEVVTAQNTDVNTFEGILKKNEILNSSRDHSSKVKASKSKKKQLKLRLKKDGEPNSNDIGLENSKLSKGLTTENVKKWKLRIKVKLDENKDEESEVNCTETTKNEEKTNDDCDSDSNEPLAFKKYFKGLRKKDKIVKVAPLFMKAKAKLSSETLKARKRFLYSEMPTSLRKVVEKQKVEEAPHHYFPTISHVTIEPTHEQLENSPVNFWNLPVSNLKFSTVADTLPSLSSATLKFLSSNTTTNDHAVQLKSCKTVNTRKELKRLKTENPNYPVYKTFKYLHNKLKSCEIENADLFRDKLWTDLYKPNCSEEIFGNNSGVSKLKSWLQEWLDLKRNRDHSDSNSDFEDFNDSRKNSRNCDNTMILHGPHGSGKTMAVYAICDELGMNVIEVNASSKRTGKRLLNDLQEATQSHQVHKNPLNGFVTNANSETSNSQTSDYQSTTSSQQMCLLLIEDVDIIFDQDENFISALLELISTSKRPLILTTTDKDCLHLRRFTNEHSVVNFTKLSPRNAAVWLQVLSLVEGSCVEKDDLVSMLDKNKNDMRSTLLELQFWLQSIENAKTPPSTFEATDENSDKLLLSSGSSEDTNESLVMSNFEPKVEPIKITTPINLGRLWWEFPPKFSENKLLNLENKSEPDLLQQNKNCKTNLETLKNYSNALDTLALVDVWYTRLNLSWDLEPVHRLKTNVVKDSLSLRESSNSFCVGRDLCHDQSYFLLSKRLNSVEQCNVDTKSFEFTSNVKRWRRNQNSNSELLVDAISLEHNLNRRAAHADYLTVLRQIARSEALRSLCCTKRNNRFYNYLRSLGIHLNDKSTETICNMLKCT